MALESDLIAALKRRANEVTESLAAGFPASYDAYREMVGLRRGLEEALGIFDSLLEEKDRADDSR